VALIRQALGAVSQDIPAEHPKSTVRTRSNYRTHQGVCSLASRRTELSCGIGELCLPCIRLLFLRAADGFICPGDNVSSARKGLLLPERPYIYFTSPRFRSEQNRTHRRATRLVRHLPSGWTGLFVSTARASSRLLGRFKLQKNRARGICTLALLFLLPASKTFATSAKSLTS